MEITIPTTNTTTIWLDKNLEVICKNSISKTTTMLNPLAPSMDRDTLEDLSSLISLEIMGIYVYT